MWKSFLRIYDKSTRICRVMKHPQQQQQPRYTVLMAVNSRIHIYMIYEYVELEIKSARDRVDGKSSSNQTRHV